MIGKMQPAAVETLLAAQSLGRIGCADRDKVYVVPVNYVYHDGCIICHSLAGMKIDIMRKHPEICFEVEAIQSYTEWQSVIAWGRFEELQTDPERKAAMDLLVEKMMRLKLSESAIVPERTEERVHPRAPGYIRPVLFRIRLTEKTGRFEHAD